MPPESHYSVLRLLLATGERLPCLVNRSTWVPATVATRWAVRYRRLRVQSSTLSGNLRVLGRVYGWANEIAKLDLDDFLCSGQILSARQIESLAAYLREPGHYSKSAGKRSKETVVYLDSGAFDNALSVTEEFLKWALEASNRSGKQSLNLEKIYLERSRLELMFNQLRVGAAQSHRIEPLDDEELKAIRSAIAPRQTEQGWDFQKVFSARTRFRNWLMFETALDLGVRRGELLKLKTTSLPRGNDTGIRVMRCPDDLEDTRTNEPAVKTAERVVPASRALLSFLNVYLTSVAPIGRAHTTSPYLFLTIAGDPVSLDRADDIIQDISGYSGVHISWHRLRHTWAERIAGILCKEPTGVDQLQWLGGWTNPDSAKRYIQNAIAKQAQEYLSRYQESLTRASRSATA